MRYFTPFLIFFFSLCCVIMGFVSCANTVPEFVSLEATVVYDYQSLQEEPVQRLSVFAQSSQGSERIMSLRISFPVGNAFPDNKLFWLIEKPLILNNGSKLWAGSPSLMPPYFGALPQGTYQVICTDLMGETAEGQFVLNYKEVDSPPLDQPIFFSQQEQSKDGEGSSKSSDEPVIKMAVFSGVDGRGTLLFFDKIRKDWKDFTDIKDSYSKAKSLRICLDYPSRQVRYLLPPHNFE